MSKKYSLPYDELQDIAAICYREQGRSEVGIKACASQMVNYHDKFWASKYSSPYQTIIYSGWYGPSRSVINAMLSYVGFVTEDMVEWVRDVINNGNRTLPDYVVEYDCLSDVKRATNNGVEIDKDDRNAYIKEVTRIQNVYGDESDSYTFYCFPDGPDGVCDAFGYFSKPEEPTETTDKEGDDMTTVEKAIRWMEDLAADNSHGYDQIYRWGEKGDYDCSSAVITAWREAGVPLTCTYTGNMYSDMTQKGFKDVTASVNLSTGAGLKRGDVLLNHVHHVAMYCGMGYEVEASINEKGGATGGQPGDQTGREILRRTYRNYPWNAILRYESTNETETPADDTTGGTTYMFTTETVQNGSTGASVRLLQTLLKGLDYYGSNGKALTIDGDAGGNTIYALRNYQSKSGLTVDGICGPATWNKILGL